MKFEQDYFVGVKDIGKNLQMTNYAFLSFMEEIASLHSAGVGFGVNDIQTKKKVWILMDWQLKVLERPKYKDKIHIKTWAIKSNKTRFFTYRDFEVYLENKKVAIGTSKWVLFDLIENKISKVTEDVISLYKPEEERVFAKVDIEKLQEEITYQSQINYEVKRADIDVNNHMHNLNYLSLAYEALPENIYNQEEKNNVRIMYKHQIILGQKVKCYYSFSEDKHKISIKSDDDEVLHAIVELK